MPSPKAGTVTPNVGDCGPRVQRRQDRVPHRRGRERARRDRAPQDFSPRRISCENLTAFVEHIRSLQVLHAAKGEFIRKVSVSTTMGPGL